MTPLRNPRFPFYVSFGIVPVPDGLATQAIISCSYVDDAVLATKRFQEASDGDLRLHVGSFITIYGATSFRSSGKECSRFVRLLNLLMLPSQYISRDQECIKEPFRPDSTTEPRINNASPTDFYYQPSTINKPLLLSSTPPTLNFTPPICSIGVYSTWDFTARKSLVGPTAVHWQELCTLKK
ncbi:hypothetical protein LZ554_007002 [Drepanopeziza brunnea f. sp. 'monogermtubi']|nr:hypothetical protein LZ554_007002 [Drepanopeziza brunnea f. sp. 'monogermtubi']